MLKLYAIFSDDPGVPFFQAVEIDDQMREGKTPNAAFEEGTKEGTVVGRPIWKMWTVDIESEQGNVAIRAFGNQVPIPTTPDTLWYE